MGFKCFIGLGTKTDQLKSWQINRTLSEEGGDEQMEILLNTEGANLKTVTTSYSKSSLTIPKPKNQCLKYFKNHQLLFVWKR